MNYANQLQQKQFNIDYSDNANEATPVCVNTLIYVAQKRLNSEKNSAF